MWLIISCEKFSSAEERSSKIYNIDFDKKRKGYSQQINSVTAMFNLVVLEAAYIHVLVPLTTYWVISAQSSFAPGTPNYSNQSWVWFQEHQKIVGVAPFDRALPQTGKYLRNAVMFSFLIHLCIYTNVARHTYTNAIKAWVMTSQTVYKYYRLP